MASNSEGGTRKLAAIMFTDVKDFSKKMGENETAAMDVLKVHDDTMRQIVAKHNGVVIKSLGDSFMVDFSSAVNAVRCAIEAQERFWEYSKDKVEFEKIQIRIGIHLGDVMNVGNDIYGDGVNIAARIEAITEANRICVSAEIYNQVKNKMPIRAFSLGETDLKNIAEPVEVFELLLDSIPELAEPSESAKQRPTRRKADLISAQENEEAKRVEGARQKVDEKRQREEAEKMDRANAYFAKAEEYFRSDNLEKAEEQIREIYKIVQVHYEAQMLILQIEERRARLEEEERRRRVKEEKQRKEDERKQRIDKCLDVALQFVDKEEFTEALNALQEVYVLEPNNEQAKRIEKQVQLAEEARLERQRLEAQAAEEQAREEALRLQKQRAEESAQAALEQAASRKKEQTSGTNRRYLVIAGAAILLVAVVVAVLLLTRGSLKEPAEIAVLPFTVNQSDQAYVGDAIAYYLSDEIGRAPGMKSFAPTSAPALAAKSANMQGVATSLGISHVLSGSITLNGPSVTVTAELTEISSGKKVWEHSVQGSLLDLNRLAAEEAGNLFSALEIVVPATSTRRLTENAEAYSSYLRGLTTMMRPSPAEVGQGVAWFRDALQKDSTFSAARISLAWALLDTYKLGGSLESPLLAQAAAIANSALPSESNNALTHLVFGSIYRHQQQFAKAKSEIEAALALQPGNAECQRELARLSLINGKPDDALAEASLALQIDPFHYRSSLVKGIALIFKEQYEDAGRMFDNALAYGAPDSLTTVQYLFRLWADLDREDRIVGFCQNRMTAADDRGKVLLYYWMGRAYQLQGKLPESQSNFDQGIQLADHIVSVNQKDISTLATYALLQARRAKSPKVALQLGDRARSLDGGSAAGHYLMARIYAIQSDSTNALSELAKAVAIEYRITDIIDPDFLSVWKNPKFAATITRGVDGRQ